MNECRHAWHSLCATAPPIPDGHELQMIPPRAQHPNGTTPKRIRRREVRSGKDEVGDREKERERERKTERVGEGAREKELGA